jgi:hypothetical protein
MDNTEDLISSLQTVRKTFDSLGIRYFIGGSVASSFHGAMRSTMDVDVVAELTLEHVRPILAAVAGEYYSSESAMRDAIQRRSSFNLIHLPTSFKVGRRKGDGGLFTKTTPVPFHVFLNRQSAKQITCQSIALT